MSNQDEDDRPSNERDGEDGEKDEEDGDRDRRSRRRKFAVFEESGLTEEDRRNLRRKQRDLHHRVNQEVGRDENEGVMEFLSERRDENNQLFNKVAYTREAVLDADNAELIAAKTLQQVDQMVQVPRFDATKLANRLRSKLSVGEGANKYFSWWHLGKECGVCFNAVPWGVSFLAGTLDAPETVVRKARKARAKKNTADELVELKVGQADEKNGGTADNLSAAEKAMKVMRKKLKKLSVRQEGDEENREVNGVEFLFNPKSFTQTVENIFNYSFLVKSGEGQIRVRSAKDAARKGGLPGLVVRHVEKDDDDDDAEGRQGEDRTQAVVAFTMRDWRRICQAHQLEEGLLPHRTGSKQRGGKGSQQHSSQDM